MTTAEETTPLRGEAEGMPELYESRYWRPACKNWQVIDWAKWDALNPKPPTVYDPPQLKPGAACNAFCGGQYCLNWFGHRSAVCNPCCCCIPVIPCLRHCFGPKKQMSTFSQDSDEFFKELLDPNIASPYTPDALRGVLWTRDNVVHETVITPQNWAWKSNAKGGVGPVGLGSLRYNWSGDPTCYGLIYDIGSKNFFLNVQVHPNGKWISLAFVKDPSPEAEVTWIWMYVVQEGDTFTAPDGSRMDRFKPGSIIRITWDNLDPYACDNSKVSYMYALTRVAILEKDSDGTEKVVKVQPFFDELVAEATGNVEVEPCCCGRFTCNMTGEERLVYHNNELSDLQTWAKGPPPPSPEAIDRL